MLLNHYLIFLKVLLKTSVIDVSSGCLPRVEGQDFHCVQSAHVPVIGEHEPVPGVHEFFSGVHITASLVHLTVHDVHITT